MVEDLNTTYRTVSSWETGEKTPRLNKLEEIATYLNVSVSSLLKKKFQMKIS